MIFVIDDDREWLGYYERLFCDYEVEVFSDGVAAMERMGEVVPDMVILDILLVGPTGFSVMNEMQSYEDLANVPVVVVSGVTVDKDLREYGAVMVFDKGKMLPEELLAVVKEYYGQHKD